MAMCRRCPCTGPPCCIYPLLRHAKPTPLWTVVQSPTANVFAARWKVALWHEIVVSLTHPRMLVRSMAAYRSSDEPSTRSTRPCSRSAASPSCTFSLQTWLQISTPKRSLLSHPTTVSPTAVTTAAPISGDWVKVLDSF